MTVSTFYPDPGDPAAVAIDGEVQDSDDAVWSTIRNTATGSGAFPTNATMDIAVRAATTTNVYDYIARGFCLFDTSSLTGGATISAATLEFVVTTLFNSFAGGDSVSMVLSTPASNTTYSTSDWDQFGTTLQATNITCSSITNDNSTYNPMTLNSTGRGNISLTSISKFGLRTEHDKSNTDAWATGNPWTLVKARTADESGTSKDIKLVVTFIVETGFPHSHASGVI